MSQINWQRLETFAEELTQTEGGPAQQQNDDFVLLRSSLSSMKDDQDWDGVLRLRDMFETVFAQDTMTINDIFMELNQLAIHAAEVQHKEEKLAQFLSAWGQALHRMGMHRDAIEKFNRSYEIYMREGKTIQANESLHMTALCWRPLGETRRAREVLQTVISSCEMDDPWLGHPLRTLAWLERDENKLEQAEVLVRKGLDFFINSDTPLNIIAEQLSDLAEIVGLQKRYQEARDLYDESLSKFQQVGKKVARQVARAQTKYAELELRTGNLSGALDLLDQADSSLRSLGPYYDQMWKIEMMSVNIHLRMGNWGMALRKLRSAISAFRKTKMKPSDFVRQVANRAKIGSGI